MSYIIGRSFIYSKNNSGPSIDPWGTPDITGNHADGTPEMKTRCWRPDKYEHNHLSREP